MFLCVGPWLGVLDGLFLYEPCRLGENLKTIVKKSEDRLFLDIYDFSSQDFLLFSPLSNLVTFCKYLRKHSVAPFLYYFSGLWDMLVYYIIMC